MSAIVKFELRYTVGMVQLNLNLMGYACMRHGLDKTCSSFHTCASMCVHKILKMLNLLFRALVYELRRCKHDSLQMHLCM